MNFNDFALSDRIMKAIAELGYTEPTPIQALAIPLILAGKDVAAKAPTGTGKTCAFGAPAINKIDADNASVQALILCPTRELAVQVAEELKKLGKFVPRFMVAAIYGGQGIEKQFITLKRKPQIVVGTPGRVMDHMRRGTLDISGINTLILDEADEMLNMGFKDDLDIILQDAPKNRQTLLFSATMPKQILAISGDYQKDAEHISLEKETKELDLLKQFYIEVREQNKLEVLTRLLDANQYKLVLVFCNTKRRADDLSAALVERNFGSDALHGDLNQGQRDRVMLKFRKGNMEILVATDVAARGIDVGSIDAVINYDIPDDPEYYIHRIGRTARANKSGVSISLISGREIYSIKAFERATGVRIEYMAAPSQASVIENKAEGALETVRQILDSGAQVQYRDAAVDMAEKITEQYGDLDIEDLCAALLKLTVENKLKFFRQEIPEAAITPIPRKKLKLRAVEASVRFFINLGSKDGLDMESLRDYVTKTLGLNDSDVFDVRLLDTFSFFELNRGTEEKTLRILNAEKYGGRRVSVEIAQDKRGGSARPEREGRRVQDRRGGFTKGYGDREDKDRRGFTKSYGERETKDRRGGSSWSGNDNKKPYDKRGGFGKGGYDSGKPQDKPDVKFDRESKRGGFGKAGYDGNKPQDKPDAKFDREGKRGVKSYKDKGTNDSTFGRGQTDTVSKTGEAAKYKDKKVRSHEKASVEKFKFKSTPTYDDGGAADEFKKSRKK